MALLTDPEIMVFGYAVENDIGFLSSECRRYKKDLPPFAYYDIQDIYRIYREWDRSPSLEDALKDLEVPFDDYAEHQSSDDAKMSMKHLGIAWFVFLPGSGNGHIVRSDIFVDGTTGSDKGPFAKMYRRNDGRTRANEGVVADFAMELIHAIVVRDDRAAADINPSTNLGIAEIRKMRGF